MRIFADINNEQRRKLQWDGVAEFSTTDVYVARRMSEILSRYGSTCIDATACVGGMTRFLCEKFEHVTAIEIDTYRFLYLKNNMETLEIQNVTCIHGDCLDSSVHVDVIFIDPPWGGPGYKYESSLRLSLSDVPLNEVCDKLALNARYIALKVPVNFDEYHFISSIRKCVPHSKIQFLRMNLLILKTCPVNT